MKNIEKERVIVNIIPERIIFKRDLYKITNIDKKYIIKEYTIQTYKNGFEKLILKSPHPNAIPKTGEFCIPERLIGKPVDSKLKFIIETQLLVTYNLDNCYFTPWDELQCQYMEG